MSAVAGTSFATSIGMRVIEPARWDDYVLAVLLLLIGLPRVILATLHDRPIGVKGTISIVCVGLALLVLARQQR